jgi:hypothetical protein
MTAEDAKDFARPGHRGHPPAGRRRARHGRRPRHGRHAGPANDRVIATPVQFLQTWLPGFVRTMTQARKIDDLIGMQVVGNWEDEEIVQGIMEPTAPAVLYSDAGNVPLTGWNPTFERRSVLRFEQGIASRPPGGSARRPHAANTAAEKRALPACPWTFNRNRVGFLGYNGGANRTYGFLNDPSLPAYRTPRTARRVPAVGQQDLPRNHRRHSRHGAALRTRRATTSTRPRTRSTLASRRTSSSTCRRVRLGRVVRGLAARNLPRHDREVGAGTERGQRRRERGLPLHGRSQRRRQR